MKDRRGHEFTDLINYQAADLGIWESRLNEQVHRDVVDYVRWANLEADSVGVHRVYRGQDIVQLILSWPTIPEGYAKRPLEESVL